MPDVAIAKIRSGENKRILWVDDMPQSNALEIAQLQDRGYQVVQALSTQDVLEVVNKNIDFAAVISDMSRREGGIFHRYAGLALLRALRSADFKAPFLIYTSQLNVNNHLLSVIAAGGEGATGSAVELLEWVESATRKSSN